MNFWFNFVVLLACLNTDLFVLGAPTTKRGTTKLIGSSSIVTRPTRTTKPPKQAEFDPQKFLLDNGYGIDTDSEKVLSKKFGSFTDLSKNENFKKMIKIYQSLHNLTVTGSLDDKTKQQMLAPRCGLPELPVKLPTENIANAKSKPGTSFGSFKTASKWSKDELTWSLINFTPDLGLGATRKAITEAFKYWSDVSSLKFKEVCTKCPADLKIVFGEYHHGDPYPFDGSGRVLAHAFFPSDGRIHFDDAERFTEGKDDGINLRIVAAHEIGHALGLDHTNVNDALMAPTYRYSYPFRLHNDDIQGIQYLYPKKAGPPTPRPNTTPKGSGIKSVVCTEVIDAIFTGPTKGDIRFVINKDELWNFNMVTGKWNELSLYDTYDKVQAKLRGGAQDGATGYTWFFRGRQAWAYNGNKLVSGYPKLIYDRIFPNNPETSVFYNGILYVLKANLAYKFDTKTLQVIDYPQYISQLFPGVQDWTDAAFSLGNNILFIKDKSISIFNQASKRVEQTISKTNWSPFCTN